MSEFSTDTLPNDDRLHPGENLLYPQEEFLPACDLLSELSGEPPEELQQFLDDFRTQTRSGDAHLATARWNDANRELAQRIPRRSFLPHDIPHEMVLKFADVVSQITWVNQVIQVDELAGEENEHITRSLLFDEKSPTFIGKAASRVTEDLPELRAKVDSLGGAAIVTKSLERLREELATQLDWSYIVQGVHLHGGMGIPVISTVRPKYVELAESTFRTLKDESRETRLEKILAMKQHIAGSFAHRKYRSDDPLTYYWQASDSSLGRLPLYDLEQQALDKLLMYVPAKIAEEAEQGWAQQRADRAAEIQSEYNEHIEQAVPMLSGKARKREGYEGMWNSLIGRAQDKAVVPMLDNEATRILSTLHALRKMVEPSFDGVRDAQTWQQETRAYEQALTEEYAALGHQKGLSLKESVGARLDWLGSNWDFVAGQARAIPGFPVQRIAAALFPEVAPTIQEQEQRAERQQAATAQRLGSTSLEQLIVTEVDWEILPVEHVAASIQNEATRMTRGKQRSEMGRRALQEVRVRDLVELSTLFDDAVVHVSREKDGITRRKNEPYFVITFTYGGKNFALAENLVLDNATFLLPEGEFDWRDVFSLPRGAVGEFGAKRINHPSVDETGEYEGGPNAHVNAIFAKLDKALTDQ